MKVSKDYQWLRNRLSDTRKRAAGCRLMEKRALNAGRVAILEEWIKWMEKRGLDLEMEESDG